MTGFPEESRRTVRGTLSDLIVSPRQGERSARGVVSEDPKALLRALRAEPRVAAAAPQLLWGGIITQRGEMGKNYERLLASSNMSHSGLLAIQLVGIDVDVVGRLAWPLTALVARRIHGCFPRPVVQDELDASAFLRSLIGDEPGETWTVAPPNPLLPFLPPKRAALGRPKAGVLIGEQLFTDLAMRVGQVVEIGTAVFDPARDDWRMSNREFVIAGTFRTRENETDLGRIYLDRRELADFLGQTRGYTQVLVRLHDYPRDSAAVSADLRASLAQSGLIAGGPA